MLPVKRLLETALYVSDVERAERFYIDVFAFRPIPPDSGPRNPVFRPLEIPGGGILLLFLKGSTADTLVLPGGTIPPHGSEGEGHLAFAVDQLNGWQEHLDALGVRIEGRMKWPRGGESCYFRDPDGNLLELATPGIWQSH